MANGLIEVKAQAEGTLTYNERTTALVMPFPKRSIALGGTGYIAGNLPGVLTVDGSPATRPIELRMREGNRGIIDRTWSNPINGTYMFKDLNPNVQFDLVARDEPNYIYNDIIVGKLWPWTDYEMHMHGVAPPATLATNFTRVYELTGGTLPYSISSSSVIPPNVTVDLDGRFLTLSSTGDLGVDLDLIIEDSSTLTKTISITSLDSISGVTARAFRVYITQRSNGGATGTTASGYVNICMNLCTFAGGPNICNNPGTNDAVPGSSGGQSSQYSAEYNALNGFKYPRGYPGLWHTTNQAGPWWAYFDFGAGNTRTVRELVISPQNTLPNDRTPYDFIFQSSDDLVNWTDVAEFNGVTGWVLGEEKTFTINAGSGVVPYAAYRLFFTENNSGATTNTISLAEVDFVNRNGIKVSTGGTATSDSIYGAGWEADKAFDGVYNGNAGWSSNNSAWPHWLEYEFATPKNVYEFRVTYFDGATSDAAPKSFAIQTTQNGTTWADQYNIIGQTGWTDSETRFYRTVDPRWEMVTSVMNGNAEADATTMEDAKGNTYTFGTDAKTDRSADSGFGGSYIEFVSADTDAYVTIAANNANHILEGDFTVEAFIKFDALPSGTYGHGIIGTNGNVSDGWQLRLSSTGVEPVFPGLAGTTYAVTWEVGRVYHIVWSRSGTQHYVGVNGTAAAVTLANRTSNASNILRLGSQTYGGGWIGKMAHRITRGFCRYTSGTYQVPLAPFAEDGEPSFNTTIPSGATYKSLLHFDNVPDSIVVTDDVPRTWTRVGTPTLSHTQARFNSTSLKIPGLTSYFSAPAGIISTGEEFCIDGWIWCDPTGGAGGGATSPYFTLCGQGGSGGSQDQFFAFDETGALHFTRASGIGSEGLKQIISAAGVGRRATWHHVMLTFDSTTLRLYCDGVKVGEVATTQGWINTGQDFTLGYQIVQGYPTYALGHKGYIDEFRIVTGDPVVVGDSYIVPVNPYAIFRTPTTDTFDTNSLSDYTQQGGVADWNISGGNCSVTTSSQSTLIRTGVSFADGEVSCIISQADNAGIILRSQDSDNFYLADVFDDSSTSNPSERNKISLWKRVGGTFTQIGPYVNLPRWYRGTDHKLTFAAVGNGLTVKWDDVVMISTTDSAFTAAGNVGFRVGTNTAVYDSLTWTTA